MDDEMKDDDDDGELLSDTESEYKNGLQIEENGDYEVTIIDVTGPEGLSTVLSLNDKPSKNSTSYIKRLDFSEVCV